LLAVLLDIVPADDNPGADDADRQHARRTHEQRDDNRDERNYAKSCNSMADEAPLNLFPRKRGKFSGVPERRR